MCDDHGRLVLLLLLIGCLLFIYCLLVVFACVTFLYFFSSFRVALCGAPSIESSSHERFWMGGGQPITADHSLIIHYQLRGNELPTNIVICARISPFL